MLDRMEPLEQRCLSVTREDRDPFLGEDRPGVDPLVDEVDGHAGLGGAGRERGPHRANSGKGRQQRGVDVDDAAAENAPERRP